MIQSGQRQTHVKQLGPDPTHSHVIFSLVSRLRTWRIFQSGQWQSLARTCLFTIKPELRFADQWQKHHWEEKIWDLFFRLLGTDFFLSVLNVLFYFLDSPGKALSLIYSSRLNQIVHTPSITIKVVQLATVGITERIHLSSVN